MSTTSTLRKEEEEEEEENGFLPDETTALLLSSSSRHLRKTAHYHREEEEDEGDNEEEGLDTKTLNIKHIKKEGIGNASRDGIKPILTTRKYSPPRVTFEANTTMVEAEEEEDR